MIVCNVTSVTLNDNFFCTNMCWNIRSIPFHEKCFIIKTCNDHEKRFREKTFSSPPTNINITVIIKHKWSIISINKIFEETTEKTRFYRLSRKKQQAGVKAINFRLSGDVNTKQKDVIAGEMGSGKAFLRLSEDEVKTHLSYKVWTWLHAWMEICSQASVPLHCIYNIHEVWSFIRLPDNSIVLLTQQYDLRQACIIHI